VANPAREMRVRPIPSWFCNIDSGRIWLESEHAIAVPDAFPIADGHTIIAPRKRVGTIYELTARDRAGGAMGSDQRGPAAPADGPDAGRRQHQVE
jgi:hypothetical protein